MVKIDMIGKRFGNLTVISQAESIESCRPRWLCHCDCGNNRIVRGVSLRRGDTKSCGCLKIEHAKTLSNDNITHGESKTRLYRIWFNIRSRCNKSSHIDYPKYGARGIRVCDEWDGNFVAFRDWAMSNGYAETLSIDRIDNNGNYSPINCRWVNSEVQNNNKRSNHYLTYNGETLTLAQWAKKFGINKNTLYSRIVKYGWNVERSLTEGVIH